MLLLSNGILFLLLITLPLLSIPSYRDNPWVWVSLHWLARAEEIVVILCYLIIVQKRKPEKPDSTGSSSKRVSSKHAAVKSIGVSTSGEKSEEKTSDSSGPAVDTDTDGNESMEIDLADLEVNE
jgi:hypothetical protein